MKLYTDKELLNQIIGSFSLGIVPVGETIQKTIWIKNDSDPKPTGQLIDIEIDIVCLDPTNDTVITDEHIAILESPDRMDAFAVAPIKLEWCPAIDLEQGLRAKLTIKAKKIIG